MSEQHILCQNISYPLLHHGTHVRNNDALFSDPHNMSSRHKFPISHSSFSSHFTHWVAQHLGTRCPSHSSPVLQPWTQRRPHPCQFCTCPLSRKKVIRLSWRMSSLFRRLEFPVLSKGSKHSTGRYWGETCVLLNLPLPLQVQLIKLVMSNGRSTGCHGTDLIGRLAKMVKQIWHEDRSTCLLTFVPFRACGWMHSLSCSSVCPCCGFVHVARTFLAIVVVQAVAVEYCNFGKIENWRNWIHKPYNSPDV